MTINEFIKSSQESTGSGKVRLMPAQEAVYYEKLQRFTGAQLSAIYDKVLELTEHFPKIKNIYDAARELGYLTDFDDKQYKPHTWEPKDCRLCSGSGMCAVLWSRKFEKTDSGVVQEMRLLKILPYHDSPKETAYDVRTIYRCQCASGDAQTLPKGWPKWSNDNDPIIRRPW